MTCSQKSVYIVISLICIVDFFKNQGLIAAAPNGATCTITSPNSEVTLQVPEEAIQEIVIGRVHTDVSKFRFCIPENEFPILHAVEYAQKFKNSIHTNRKFKIHIPHNINNLGDKTCGTKVRYGNLHQTAEMLKLASQIQSKDEPVSYEITNREVTIYTPYLTGFLVTIPRAIYFSKYINLQFFGSLTRREDEKSIAKVTALLHNPLKMHTEEGEKVLNIRLFTTVDIF